MSRCATIKLYDPNKKEKITVSSCISNELQWLWDKGIDVIDCDCGERYGLGYIYVNDKDIDYMTILGYENYKDKTNVFIPKTYKHISSSYFE